MRPSSTSPPSAPRSAPHATAPANAPVAALLMLAGLVLVAAITGWLAFIAADYQRTVRETQAELSRLTGLLNEHAQRTVEASDLVLQRLADRLDDADLQALRGREDIFNDLVDMRRELPQIGSLWVIDSQGAVVASSMQQTPVPGDFDDRAYFRVHADGPDAGADREMMRGGLFVDELMVGRHTGLNFFSITRAIRDSRGTFRGIVVAAIHTDYFQTFYRALGLEDGGSVAVLRTDGALLVREPMPEKIVGIRVPDITRSMSADSPMALSIAPSPLDGTERIIARRLVPEYPLVVLASRTTESALQNWRARTLQTGLAALGVVAAGSVLAAFGLAALRRQHAMENALREARTALEQRVAERTASLAAANADLERTVGERDLLLREVYHRVKNNMQQVDALIALQSRDLSQDEARQVLQDMRLRINALGTVHQQLLQSADLRTFSLRGFLQELGTAIAFSVGAQPRGIAVRVEADPVPVDLDLAIPLGLLVNEWMTNAFRHAFPDGRPGTITVTCRKSGGRLILRVSDDGVGYAPDKARPTPTTGARIIEALVQQLRASAEVEAGHGTTCVATIPLAEEMQDA